MGSLKVGSAVTNPDGSVARVIGIYPLGQRQLYRVTFHDGTSCEVTDDHIWLAWRSNKSRKQQNDRISGEASAQLWTTAEMMRVLHPKRRFLIPIAQPVPFNDTARGERRPVPPYALGVLLGDGSFGQSGVTFCSEDQAIADRMRELLGEDMSPTTYDYAHSTPAWRIRSGSPTVSYLRRVGLIGSNSFTKRIPEAYLLGSVQQRWELLRGLMDTDGWADLDGDIYFGTSGEGLRDDVAALARSLGAVVTIREKTPTFTNGDGLKQNGAQAYTLRIKIRNPADAFYIERKKARCTRAPQSMNRTIVSIEAGRVAEAQCIKVSHPNGLYLTNDYIVTHNTEAVLGEWVSHAQQYGQDAIGLMVRRQRTELIETIERSKVIYSQLGAVYQEQKSMWTFPNGARLRFAYLERDSDANAYQGQAYTRLYVEECGNFPMPTPIFKLFGILRSGAGVPCQAILTCNPGGPGHNWVKQRYIDPAPQGYVPIEEEFINPWTYERIKRARIFIPSRLTDNKYLGADYVATLQQVGSENLVKAWLLGDWNIVEGAFFDRWSHKNIVVPFAVPPEWLRFRAADWGFSAPFSMGWYAVAGDDAEDYGLPRGCLVRYRELYTVKPGMPNVGLRLTTEELAERIKAMSKGERYAYSVIDPAAFAESGGPSIAERFARAGVEFRRADNRRLGARGAMGGWDQLRARIIGEDERPMLVTFSTCTELIRTLPILQHDPDRPEDLDTQQEDHAADECFVAGTMVETADGPKPIESLQVGDRVETRQGLMPVEAVFTVGERDVFDLKMSDGSVLTGTGNHPIFTENDWQTLEGLSYGTMLSPCVKRSNFKASNSTAIPNTRTATSGSITGRIANLCTGLFGKVYTVQFRHRNGLSTIETATRSTTTYRIWNWLSAASTQDTIGPSACRSSANVSIAERISKTVRSTLRSSAAMLVNRLRAAPRALMTWIASALPVRVSIVATDTGRAASIAPAHARLPESLNDPISTLPVSSAGIRPSPRIDAPCSAAPHVVSVTPAGRQRVYNLTVAGAEEYYANGILVHNCRYAVMSRPWVPRQKPKPEEGRSIHNMTLDEAWKKLREPVRAGRI